MDWDVAIPLLAVLGTLLGGYLAEFGDLRLRDVHHGRAIAIWTAALR